MYFLYTYNYEFKIMEMVKQTEIIFNNKTNKLTSIFLFRQIVYSFILTKLNMLRIPIHNINMHVLYVTYF